VGKTRIDIEDNCDWVKQRIHNNLQAILIESTLLQDTRDEYNSNSSWTNAVKEEELSCQKLLTQAQDDSASRKKNKPDAFFKATETPHLKTFRRYIPITVVIALVFLMVMVYMTNPHRNDSFLGEVRPQEKGTTLTSVHPVTKSKPKVSNTGQDIKRHDQPVQTAASSMKTDPIIKEKSVNTASQIKLLPPAPRFRIKPAPAPSSPIVFIHYTYPKNRGRADQLADYLTHRGFVIKGVEQVAFHRNDIRFFQAADREKARTLHNQITRFLVDLGKLKTIPLLNLKDMTGTYSHTSPGQLEVWLRLPST